MPPATAPATERDAVWSEVREKLRETLNSQTYKFAFAGARPVSLDDDRVVLAVNTELLRSWICQRYLPLIRDALFEVRNADLEVEIIVDPSAPGLGRGVAGRRGLRGRRHPGAPR